MKKSIVLMLLCFPAISIACPEGPGTIVVCNECSQADEITEAFESQVPNEDSVSFTLGQLRLAITFSTFGINSTTYLPFNKTCDQSWEEAVQDQWTEVQAALSELLLASGGGGGGTGSDGGGLGSGGGAYGGDSGGRVGGDDYCYYSDGDPLPGNDPSCPPSDPNVSLGD